MMRKSLKERRVAWLIFPIISVPIRSVRTMVLGVEEILQPVQGMESIILSYLDVKLAIKDSPRIVTRFLCTLIIARRPSNALF
jgi:hypothetical protein